MLPRPRLPGPPFGILAILLVLVGGPTATVRAQAPDSAGEGVRVVAVQPGSPGALMGLQPGDRLLGWRGTAAVPAPGLPAAGRFADADAFEMVAVTIAPRLAVTLDVDRDGQRTTIPVPVRASRLGLEVEPAPETTTRFDRLLADGRLDEAASVADEMLGRLGSGSLEAAAWQLRRASLRRQRGQLDAAHADAEAALQVRRALAAGSWDEADALAELGRMAVARRQLNDALPLFESALAIVGRAQSTIESVRLGFAIADVEWRQGRLPEAERRVRALMALTDDLAPASVEQARNFNLLGILRSQSGDLPAAERAFERSRALHAARDPGGVDEATALNNLGIAAMQRGRYADAESFYRQSLALKERLQLPPMERMSTIGNLGIMSMERGDLESARAYLSQALAIIRQLAPGSLQEGAVLSNLAKAERLAGRLTEAEALVRDSLAIRARLAPKTVLHAFTLSELGRTLEAGGALAAAAAAHEQALAIREQLAPDGSNVAESLDALGRLAVRRGSADEARRLHDRAGALWQRVAPGSVYEGLNLLAQARLDAATDRDDAARERYARATEIFDGLSGSIGGAFDTQADFRRRLSDAYAEYAALLLRSGDTVEAFRVTERARARVFLAMLAERDVTAAGEAPPALDEARRALTLEYDRIQANLATLSPMRDAARIDEQVGRLRDVRLKLAGVNADIARVSPRLSSLRSTAPLDAETARRVLPAGTLAVSYLAGEHASHAFVVSADGVSTFAIPWSRRRLEEEVDRFSRQLARPDSDLDLLHRLGADLYRVLLAPATAAIERHDRLVVVPDGPLHTLSFAALVRDVADARRYLVQWRAVHLVPSLTAYARLMATDRSSLNGRARVLLVGDPAYAAGEPDALAAAGASRLAALPGTRREVDAIGRLYNGPVTRLVGSQASEDRVRQAMAEADVIHLAVHGLTNARFPLDSALALSTDAGGGENGLLQAWEIFEQVRLRAGLVVLSACDTAGGRESGGEGLIGLARAFQFAGAPAVVATLWRVEDDASATLMTTFHRELRRGRPAGEALARAQRAMLRSDGSAHPYYWAAFVLNGRQ